MDSKEIALLQEDELLFIAIVCIIWFNLLISILIFLFTKMSI